ncbi:MAG: Nramp family divalent metal transporter [Planctomycetes bacterium]|nr:Nramp family divalent metal transporter [Planctomycetota bacterium]
MDEQQTSSATHSATQAPHPGSQSMPRWDTGELIDAPKFRLKNWAMMLGPGLVMGGAAIGGGEWLVGPGVTAKYGGGLLWLATLSILGQVLYNIEISRYTLYTGEPIFTGKFRTLPGPGFWVVVYLLLDFGSIFPYLAAFAATPLATMFLGEVPDRSSSELVLGLVSVKTFVRILSYCIFLGALVPLIFGGKIFNALKWVMSFKIVVLMSFLLVLGVFYSSLSTWSEIFSGFVKFGNVPIRRIEDVNGNGKLDAGEDWDGDGRLDVMEPSLALKFGRLIPKREPFATDINEDGKPDNMVNLGSEEKPVWWPDIDEDGKPDETIMYDTNGDGILEGPFPTDADGDGKLDRFVDIDEDKTQDGDNLENMITATMQGRNWLTKIDWSMIALLSALVAISGSGGLSNTPISNYTRDQGWGMGHHIGAIPSVVGGQDIQLSHVGMVFEPNEETLPRWKRWYRHVVRDQVCVWFPACFFGLALPSMLSVQFLKRGTVVPDKWVAATMTADGVQEAVGATLGGLFWGMTIFCGFLVLAPSMATSADGIIRRWVDVFWTSSKTLRKVDPKNIRYLYFGVLTIYAIFGMYMLSQEQPEDLLTIATTIFNFALGFSCWHTLAINVLLLPKELRPNWFVRIGLLLSGAFFWLVATISALQKMGYM